MPFTCCKFDVRNLKVSISRLGCRVVLSVWFGSFGKTLSFRENPPRHRLIGQLAIFDLRFRTFDDKEQVGAILKHYPRH